MLTAKNARGWFSSREGADPIAKWVDDKNKRSSLAAGDVILSDRGTVGMCAIVTAEVLPANIDQDVARISWADKTHFRPEFVVAYLNSAFGQDHIQRYSTGMIQQGITLQKIREIPIPKLSDEFQSAIVELVQSAYRAKCDSSRLIAKSETILLTTLDLADWHPPEPLTYTHSSKAVFQAERLDALYFSPTKTYALDALGKGRSKPLSACADSVRDMFNPQSSAASGKVRNYDLSDALQPVLDDEQLPVSVSEVGSLKKRLENGDVVISRLRAYLKEIAVVRTSDTLDAVGSSEFIVLRPKVKGLSPETLATFLRLPPVQTVLAYCQDGCHHPRFAEDDLLSIPVPSKVHAIDSRIVHLCSQSFILRKAAKAFLARAQRAVEVAIEESESSALSFLKEEGV